MRPTPWQPLANEFAEAFRKAFRSNTPARVKEWSMCPRVWYQRNGLSESLEEYAARHAATPGEARPEWRAWGLEALGALGDEGREDTCAGKCRVAPGVAVSVPGLTPADVIEHDNPRIGSSLASALAEWERRDP
jgi:hypothetical protein